MYNLKKLFIGLLLANALSAALLAVAALCVTKLGIPSDATAGTVGIVVGAAALCAAGAVTALWAGERGLIFGTLVSVLYCILFLFLGVVLGCNMDMKTACVRIAAYLASGALGGILGVNRTQHIRF